MIDLEIDYRERDGFLVGRSAKLADWRMKKEQREFELLVDRLLHRKRLAAVRQDAELYRAYLEAKRRWYRAWKDRLSPEEKDEHRRRSKEISRRYNARHREQRRAVARERYASTGRAKRQDPAWREKRRQYLRTRYQKMKAERSELYERILAKGRAYQARRRSARLSADTKPRRPRGSRSTQS